MFSRLYQQNITWWSWTKRWALLSSWLPYIGSASLQISADIISKMETHWLSSSSCTSVLYRFLEFGVESSKWINLNKKTLQCPFESKMAFLSTESTWCYDEAKYVSPGKCVSSRFCPNLVHGSCGLLGTCPQVGCQMMDGKAIGRVKREDSWRMVRQSDIRFEDLWNGIEFG